MQEPGRPKVRWYFSPIWPSLREPLRVTAASSTPQCAGPSAAAHDSSRVKETRMGSIDTEVLVVGAGPAGSAAAYHLASSGVDVLLVDRARFPREKVCGDGLTPYGVRALERMGVDPADPGFTRVDGLRAYGMNGFVIDLPWP